MKSNQNFSRGATTLLAVIFCSLTFAQSTNIASISSPTTENAYFLADDEDSEEESAAARLVKAAVVKRSFTDEVGKLYWQKKLPVYLFASSQPNGSDPKKLESETTADYANPLFLDTEGVNFIRTRWAVDGEGNKVTPEMEVMFEIYADGIAPVTRVGLDANRYRNADGQVFYGQGLAISATATDEMSGVAKTFYAINSGQFSEYNNAIKIEKEGEYEVKMYTTDNVGNKEDEKTYNFSLDVSAPVTKHLVSGEHLNTVLSPRSRIELETTDNLSGARVIYYQIDDGERKTYYNHVPLSYLTDGNHKLTYYAVDHVKNEETEKSFEFYLDKTPPESMVELKGDVYEDANRVYVSHQTNVEINATDNKSGVMEIRYRIDQNNENLYSSPFKITEKDGDHTLKYYAIDKVSNDGNAYQNRTKFSVTKRIKVDATAPSLANWYIGKTYNNRDTVFITSKTKINLKAIDVLSGLKSLTYQTNGGAETSYNKPFTIAEEGIYNIKYVGTDNVNNNTSKAFFFVVDNSGPEISHTMSSEAIGSISLDDYESAIKVYSIGTKVYLAATDKVIDTRDIFCKLNDGEKVKYVNPLVLGKKGINTLEVWAYDKLNNESESTHKIEVFVK